MQTTENKLFKRVYTVAWWVILIALGWTLATCTKDSNTNNSTIQEENNESSSSGRTGEQDNVRPINTSIDANPILSIQGYDLTSRGTVPGRLTRKSPISYKLPHKDVEPVSTQTQNAESRETVDTYGDPITAGLASKLVLDFDSAFAKRIAKVLDNEEYFNKSTKVLTEEEKLRRVEFVRSELSEEIVYWVSFSRQSILMLLAQPNCVGFKAYYCLGLPERKGEARKPSIILVGVDKNNNDLNSDDIRPDGRDRSIIIRDPKKIGSGQGAALAQQKTLLYEVGGTDNPRTRSFLFKNKIK